MSEFQVIAIVVAVAFLTWLAIQIRPNMVRAYFFDPLESGRTLAGGVLAALFVWVGLQGGFGVLFIAAIVVVAFATAFFIIQQPHKDVV